MDEQYFIIRNAGNQGPLGKREVIQLILDKSIGQNHLIIVDKEPPRKAIDFLVFREYFEQEIELQEMVVPDTSSKKAKEPEIIVKGRKQRGQKVGPDGEFIAAPKKELDYEKLGMYALIGGAGIFFLILIYIIASSVFSKKPATTPAYKEDTKVEKTEEKKPANKAPGGGRKLPTLDDFK